MAVLAFTGLALLNEPRPTAGFPNASDTGVPAGTSLTAYAGPCTITAAGTVIDAKTVDNCSTGLIIHASGVVIRNSQVNTRVTTENGLNYSVTIEDSEVHAGVVNAAAVGSTNLSVHRSEITGGKYSVSCTSNCALHDNWLHGQRRPTEVRGDVWPMAAIHSGGPSAPGTPLNLTAIRNTIACDVPITNAGGCRANVDLHGDTGAISNALIDANLFRANDSLYYCLFGGDMAGKAYPKADHVAVKNNVFERGSTGQCGDGGPVAWFDPTSTGNVWSSNIDDTGTALTTTPPPVNCALPNYPKPTCTGVPPNTDLTTLPNNVDGVAYSVTTPNTVLDHVHIAGILLVRANNVTIRNSVIDEGIQNDLGGGAGTQFFSYLVEDTTVGVEPDPGTTPIAGQPCRTQPGLMWTNYTARRVKVIGNDDGFRVTWGQPGADSVVIEDSYARLCWNPPELAPPDGSHSGGMQADCGTDQFGTVCHALTFTHNTVDQSQINANSGITVQSYTENEVVGPVLIQDNLLMGGGYTVWFWWSAGLPYEIHNNRIVNGLWTYGPVDALSTCENQNWSGNSIVTIDYADYTIASTVSPLACVD